MYLRLSTHSDSGNPIPLPPRNATKVKREPQAVSLRFRESSPSPPRPSSSNSIPAVSQSPSITKPSLVAPREVPVIHFLSGSNALPLPPKPLPAQAAPLAQVQPQPQPPTIAQQSPAANSAGPSGSSHNGFDRGAISSAEQLSIAQQTLKRLSESTNLKALIFPVSPLSNFDPNIEAILMFLDIATHQK